MSNYSLRIDFGTGRFTLTNEETGKVQTSDLSEPEGDFSAATEVEVTPKLPESVRELERLICVLQNAHLLTPAQSELLEALTVVKYDFGVVLEALTSENRKLKRWVNDLETQVKCNGHALDHNRKAIRDLTSDKEELKLKIKSLTEDSVRVEENAAGEYPNLLGKDFDPSKQNECSSNPNEILKDIPKVQEDLSSLKEQEDKQNRAGYSCDWPIRNAIVALTHCSQQIQRLMAEREYYANKSKELREEIKGLTQEKSEPCYDTSTPVDILEGIAQMKGRVSNLEVYGGNARYVCQDVNRCLDVAAKEIRTLRIQVSRFAESAHLVYTGQGYLRGVVREETLRDLRKALDQVHKEIGTNGPGNSF